MNSTEAQRYFDPKRFYVIIVPLLMSGTFVALLGNFYLLMCIKWIRQQAMTANLRLSLSLAGADAWAATLLLNGWTINNVIPAMFNHTFGDWIRCYYLVLELLRLSGMVTSAVHLLALALNHFFSIISPLKYQTTVTPTFSYVVITFLWVSPIVSMLTLASVYDGDGFRARLCANKFYFHFPFRLALFLQFVAPLCVMSLLYSYILIRLSAAKRRCALWQKPLRKHSSRINSDVSMRSSIPNNNNYNGDSSKRSRKQSSASRGSIGSHKQTNQGQEYKKIRKQSTESRLSFQFSFNRLSAVRHKIKAIVTTLLILGTFAVGWLPAVCVFVLICWDCAFVPQKSNTLQLFVTNVFVNTLIVSKLILNPFIYAYRLTEIRYALWVMHATRFGRRPLDVSRLPSKFRKMAPSLSHRTQNEPRPFSLLISSSKMKKNGDERIELETGSGNKICPEPVGGGQLEKESDCNYAHEIALKKHFNEEPLHRLNGKNKRSFSWHNYGTPGLTKI